MSAEINLTARYEIYPPATKTTKVRINGRSLELDERLLEADSSIEKRPCLNATTDMDTSSTFFS